MERQRATFQKTDCEGEVVFSLNLNRMQVLLTLLVTLVTLSGSCVGAVHWARSAVRETLDRDFHVMATQYYHGVIDERDAEMHRIINERLQRYKIEAEAPFERRLDVIETRLRTLETHVEILVEQGKHQRDVNEELLRRVHAVP